MQKKTYQLDACAKSVQAYPQVFVDKLEQQEKDIANVLVVVAGNHFLFRPPTFENRVNWEEHESGRLTVRRTLDSDDYARSRRYTPVAHIQIALTVPTVLH